MYLSQNSYDGAESFRLYLYHTSHNDSDTQGPSVLTQRCEHPPILVS